MVPLRASMIPGWGWRAGALIVFAVAGVYFGTLQSPFVFDDYRSIVQNTSVRNLAAWRQVLSPPAEAGVGGRPFANFTYALNYAISGVGVWSYHALNILIHAAVALMVFGLVRRILLRPALRGRFGGDAAGLALIVALLWSLHPLQTQTVSYASQRTEALMGLCYLGTLYGLLRYWETPSFRWGTVTLLACLLGMASKEVMVTAPLLLLGIDRFLGAGSWREVWRQRGRLHLAIATSWLLLAWLMFHSPVGQRGVGFAVGISTGDYAMTQCRAIVDYLRLTFWPAPLIFDRGPGLVTRLLEAVPFALLLAALILATLYAFRTRPAAALGASCFFLLLAPTSTIIPIAGQPIAENRAYLPSLAVLLLAVLGMRVLVGRRALVLFCLTAALGVLTVHRNADYRSAVALWTDTVAKQPANARAYCYLGIALDQVGRTREALPWLEQAVALAPSSPEARNALGNTLRRLGRPASAAVELRAAVRLNPQDAAALTNLGASLVDLGQAGEAVDVLHSAIRLQPALAVSHFYLGVAMTRLGSPQAAEELETALALDPAFAPAHGALANVLLARRRVADAVAHAQVAACLEPSSASRHFDLGQCLRRTARPADAISAFEAALRLDPDFAAAHDALGSLLIQLGRPAEGLPECQTAVRLKPGASALHNNLGNALFGIGRYTEAAAEFRAALRLQPGYFDAQHNLALALYKAASYAAAIDEFHIALGLQPQNPEVHSNLGNALARKGDLQQAVAEYETALSINPNLANATRNLASVRTALAEQAQAERE